MSCIKRYVVSEAEYQRRPRCMFVGCKREFTEEFVHATFGAAWRKSNLRPVEERLCRMQAMAHLPRLQPLAAEYKAVVDAITAARADPGYLDSIRAEIKTLEEDVVDMERRLRNAKNQVKRAKSRFAMATCKNTPTNIMRLAVSRHDTNQPLVIQEEDRIALSGAMERPEAAARHALRCPTDACGGFVTFTPTKGGGACRGACGMCGTQVCASCERAVGVGGDEEDHRCRPEDIDSVRAVKADTKPCPWPGCGVRIYRQDGCSQMWCTACNHPFDWVTGEQITDTTHLHNPHYTEYIMRRRAEGVEERDCGGMEDAPVSLRNMPAHVKPEVARRFLDIMRRVNDFRAVGLLDDARIHEYRRENERRLAGCQVLAHTIDHAEFQRRSFLTARTQTFHHEQRTVIEAACMCVMDVLRFVDRRSASPNDVDSALLKLDVLRTHFNASLYNLSERYEGRCVYFVEPDWVIVSGVKVVVKGATRLDSREGGGGKKRKSRDESPEIDRTDGKAENVIVDDGDADSMAVEVGDSDDDDDV